MRQKLTLILLLLAFIAQAADIIVLRNSTRVDAIIQEVGTSQVRYIKADNPGGPVFVLDISEINTILYNNGDVQVFTKNAQQQSVQQQQPVQQSVQQGGNYSVPQGNSYYPQENYYLPSDYKKEKPKKTEKTKKPKKPLPSAFIGLNIGTGATFNPYIINPNYISLGFDWAVSLKKNNKWAIGMYYEWAALENLSMGLQFVNGDFMAEKTTFIWGLGISMSWRYKDSGEWSSYTDFPRRHSFNYHGTPVTRWVSYNADDETPVAAPALRLGFSTKKHFYMLFDVAWFPAFYRSITDRYETGDKWYVREVNSNSNIFQRSATTVTMSFGYHFDVQPKRKTDKLSKDKDL
ncbi:MAG: hypothetical protein IJ776_06800 [Paludibacteraceae bacterium]|nr:hypothetical protein [Paludibacteraceae bacterium]